jgi:hypothetical protein
MCACLCFNELWGERAIGDDMRFCGLLLALLTSSACADVNYTTIAQLRLSASLELKFKRLFALIEQCNFALAQKNNTWLKISYDDLLRNFFLIAEDVEKTLQRSLDSQFMSVLSYFSLLICFYENILQKSGQRFCDKLSGIAPTLGDIFKIFAAEFQDRIAGNASNTSNAHVDEVAAKILKMSSFDRNFAEIARKIQSFNEGRYLNTIAGGDPSPKKALRCAASAVSVPCGSCGDEHEWPGQVSAREKNTPIIETKNAEHASEKLDSNPPVSPFMDIGDVLSDASAASPEDVLLALVWLSCFCHEPKLQHQLARVKTQIGSQLMRQHLVK